MKTKTINIYEFKELKPEIQEKVLNYFRDNNDYPFLEDYLKEHLNELLQKHKIENGNDNLKLYYSLSYCQGDGVCFVGDFFYKGMHIIIKHSNYYYHSRSTTMEFLDKKGDYIDNKKTMQFKKLYYNICKEIEKIGYESTEYEDSDENIKYLFESNEYYFRENGDIENDD